MSGFDALDKAQCAVIGFCPDYISGFIGSLFLLIDQYPIILSFALYSISLYHFELYFFLLGLSLNIDTLINWLLVTIINIPSRHEGCGNENEFPSFGTQHITVLMTMLFLALITWRKKVTIMKILSLTIIFNLVIVARIYIGINTIPELIVGASIGFVEAIFFHLVISHFLFPRFNQILNWRICKFFDVVDTFCRQDPKL